MEGRFFNSISDPIEIDCADSVLDDALILKQSLSASMSISADDEANSDEIRNRVERLLCNNLEHRKGTKILNGESIAKICRALAKSELDISECDIFFITSLTDSIYNYAADMHAKQICNVIWALARIGFTVKKSDSAIAYNIDEQLANLLLETVDKTKNGSGFQPQTCATLLWSFASLKFDFASIQEIAAFILDKILASLVKDPNLSEFHDQGISQIKDFFVYYQNQLPAEWCAQCNYINLSLDTRISKMPKEKSSATHEEVMRVLSQCTPSKFTAEKLINNCYIDIFFEDEGIAWEVDGPKHYTKNGSLNAKSIFRQGLLENDGIPVYRIKVSDWQNARDKHLFTYMLLIRSGLPIKEFKPENNIKLLLPPEPEFISAMVPVAWFQIPKPTKRNWSAAQDGHMQREDEEENKPKRARSSTQ